MSTSLSTLIIALIAISLATLSVTCEAGQVSTDEVKSRDGYYVAYREMAQMLLDRQPMIQREIMNGQLRPGRPSQSVVERLATTQGIGIMQLLDRSVRSSKCVPTNIKPDISSFPIKNKAAYEDRVVANMAGYVELEGQNPSYLPLDIDYITVSEPDKYGILTATLVGDCVSFDIKYQSLVNEDNERYYPIIGLEMFVKTNDKQEEKPEKICDFDKRFALTLYGPVHYWCQQVLSHRCSLGTRRVANLVLSSFELEFGGDNYAVGKREFSTHKLGFGCNYWDR